MKLMIYLPLLALQIAAIAGSAAACKLPLPKREAAFLGALRKHNIISIRSKQPLVGFSSYDGVSPFTAVSCPSIGGQLGETSHANILSSTSLTTMDSLKLLRGGGGALPWLNSIPIPSSNAILIASKFMAAYVIFLGTYVLVAPVTYANYGLKGILQEVEEDSFDSSLLQSIGAIIIGFALHLILALSKTLASDGANAISLNHAMGYALLPRILLILWSFLRSRFQESKDYQFEGTSFVKINFFMMSWCAFSLLTNAGNPAISAKVFSTMALIKAMALVLNPVKMTEKIFGINVSGEEMSQSRFLSRALGKSLAVHAILMLSLSCGVNPSAAVGISAFAWAALPFCFWVLHIDRKNGGFSQSQD